MQQMRSSNGPRKFVYRGAERTKEDIEAAASDNRIRIIDQRFPVYKYKEGRNTIRILPQNDKKEWYEELIVHYNVGPDNNQYLCLKMLGKPCAICDERIALGREGEADAAKQLAPTYRYITWIIDRAKPGPDRGPEVCNMPGKKMKQNIMGVSLDPEDRSAIHVDDPDNGYDIIFQVTNAGKQNADYTQHQVARRPSPISDNQREYQQWIDYVIDHPLSDCLKFYSYEHIDEVLHGSVNQPSKEAEPIRHHTTSLRDAEPEYDEQTGAYNEEQGQGQGSDEAETDSEEDTGVPFDQTEEEVAQQETRPGGFIQRPVPPRQPQQGVAGRGERTPPANSQRQPAPQQAQQAVHRLRPPNQRPSSRQ